MDITAEYTGGHTEGRGDMFAERTGGRTTTEHFGAAFSCPAHPPTDRVSP
jgi:hypothetical protein